MAKIHRYPIRPKYLRSTELPIELRANLKRHGTLRKTTTAGPYVNGKEHGWHYLFTNDRIACEQRYVDGAVRENRKFSNGTFRLSHITRFNFRNKVLTIINVDDYGRHFRLVPTDRDRKVHGVYKEWDCRTGRLYLTATFRKGNLHGPLTVYHPNGNVKETLNMSKGKRNGHLRVYYPSGQLKLVREYINDRRLGWATMWASDGTHVSTLRVTRDNSWAHKGRTASQKLVTTDIHKFIKFVKENKYFGRNSSMITFFATKLNEMSMPKDIDDITSIFA